MIRIRIHINISINTNTDTDADADTYIGTGPSINALVFKTWLGDEGWGSHPSQTPVLVHNWLKAEG